MKLQGINSVTNQHHTWYFLVILQKFREIDGKMGIRSKKFEKIRESNWIWGAMVFIPREFCVQFHCTKKSLGKNPLHAKFRQIDEFFESIKNCLLFFYIVNHVTIIFENCTCTIGMMIMALVRSTNLIPSLSEW